LTQAAINFISNFTILIYCYNSPEKTPLSSIGTMTSDIFCK
jgi:hypothetical protein